MSADDLAKVTDSRFTKEGLHLTILLFQYYYFLPGVLFDGFKQANVSKY